MAAMRIGLREAGENLKRAWPSTGRRYVGGLVHGVWLGLVCGYAAGSEFGPLPRELWVHVPLIVAQALVFYAGATIARGKPAKELEKPAAQARA